MKFDNFSSWDAALIPGWGKNRNSQMTCAIKVGFCWDEAGTLTPVSASDCPINYADEYYDDDAEGRSVENASDIVPFKQGFEWLLKGSLVPVPGIKQQPLVVEFLHSEFTAKKTIVATGKRYWKKSFFGTIASEAEPLTPQPICYEQSFGGRFVEEGDNKSIIYDENPVGTGYVKARQHKSEPVYLPTFEYQPILKSTKETPKPAGFNSISMTWSPRFEMFEQTDAEAAVEGLCPYKGLPPETLYNSAPEDQQFEKAIPYGSLVKLSGFQQQSITLKLPQAAPAIELLKVDGSKVEKLTPALDTLLIDTDKQLLALVYRIGLDWHPLSGPHSQIVLKDGGQENA
ncbi:DUF2169 domain-containing protein [Reinekea marinisedimentorum]|uniref:DUF2169 domain-containing protein n=1 Tax=Reinekea marinisedimentorum TaxID=230495 RepID=A0A4R3I5M9_9GAMM|nr:DUF2169 domain-containing protein [Reinekea marinisedimentorum]TCS41307.1 hypothetical protein BCF53_10638 [Reinekea marinisedimentorum]